MAERAGFSLERLARMDALLGGYVDRGELPGASVLVVRREVPIYRKVLGWMDIEAGLRLRGDAIYRIKSMTKPVAAAAAMILMEEGALTLNTPVSELIPAFGAVRVFVRKSDSGPVTEDVRDPITIRHLLTHTAGLSYGRDPADPVDGLYAQAQRSAEAAGEPGTNAALCARLASLPLAFQPGAGWRYSLSIDVLGHILELLTGRGLDELLRERLFEPLGMRDTAFHVPPEKLHRVPTVYEVNAGGDPPRPVPSLRPHQSPPTRAAAGGGLYSTVEDYSRFARMLAGGGELDGVRVLAPKTVELFSLDLAPAGSVTTSAAGTPLASLHRPGYGYSLGTRVLVDVSESGMPGSVGEFGWEGMYGTCFWVDPREGLSVVFMSQHTPHRLFPIYDQLKTLVYQAMTGP